MNLMHISENLFYKLIDMNISLWYTSCTSKKRGLFFCADFLEGGRSPNAPNFFRKTGGADSMRVKITMACSECKQ